MLFSGANRRVREVGNDFIIMKGIKELDVRYVSHRAAA